MSVAFWFDWTNSFYFVKLIKFLMLSFPCFFLQFFCRLISWNCRSNASSWIRSAFDIDSVRRRAHTHTQRESVYVYVCVKSKIEDYRENCQTVSLICFAQSICITLSFSCTHTHTHTLAHLLSWIFVLRSWTNQSLFLSWTKTFSKKLS